MSSDCGKGRGAEFRNLWHEALNALQCADLHWQQAGLRGGGATEHFLRHRDVQGLRRRGRWTQLATLDLYRQEGVLLLAQRTEEATRLLAPGSPGGCRLPAPAKLALHPYTPPAGGSGRAWLLAHRPHRGTLPRQRTRLLAVITRWKRGLAFSASGSLYIFRDLESGLRKTRECLDLKDGEPCLRRANVWWRLVAILTFTSFVTLGEKGDRPTEQSSSLFPSGQLKLNSFVRESE